MAQVRALGVVMALSSLSAGVPTWVAEALISVKSSFGAKKAATGWDDGVRWRASGLAGAAVSR